MAKRASPQNQEFPEPQTENNGIELDPLVEAMLGHLPAPGDTWPKDERELWMQILGLIFQLIYPEQDTSDQQPEPSQPGTERL